VKHTDIPFLHIKREALVTEPDFVNPRVKLRQLALAVAVHEAGSIRRGAEKLNITQPAATRSLRELEQSLGTTLFRRTRAGATPTLHGDMFVERASRILRDVQSSADEIQDLKEGSAGRISVGVGPTAAASIFPRAASLLWQKTSAITITAVQGPNEQLIPALMAGELDIVIGRLVDASQQPNLRQEVLYKDPIAIVCANDHPLTKRKNLELRQLLDQDWIMPYQAFEFRSDLADAFYIAGLEPPKPKFESATTILTVSFLRHTNMIAGMPSLVARNEQDMGAITILPVKIKSKVTPAGMTLRADSAPSPAAAAFIDELRLAAREYQ
jgi:DNA-binding transcriptional LysR family regulator